MTRSGWTPQKLPPLLLALARDAKGDWENAHTLAQDVDDPRGAWVHAYLHRKEGRSRQRRPGYSVFQERDQARVCSSDDSLRPNSCPSSL